MGLLLLPDHSSFSGLCCAHHRPWSRRSGAQPPVVDSRRPVVVLKSFVRPPPCRLLLNPTQPAGPSRVIGRASAARLPLSLYLVRGSGQWGKGLGCRAVVKTGRGEEEGGSSGSSFSFLPEQSPPPPFLCFIFSFFFVFVFVFVFCFFFKI